MKGLHSLYNKRRAGFGIAPILYLLGLVGVGAGVLFSGYSQILRSNQRVANNQVVQSDLNAMSTTLSAGSVLSTDTTYLCPPSAGSLGANCMGVANLPVVMDAISNQAKLPVIAGGGSLATYVTGSANSPVDVGVFKAGLGYKQLDPYGHYYVYCRWENPTNAASNASDATNPSIMLISAGPDGVVQTKCTDTAAVGDDLAVRLSVAVAVNRAAIWQQVAVGSSTQVEFGQPGEKLIVDAQGNLSTPGDITITPPIGTGMPAGNLVVAGSSTFTQAVYAIGGINVGTASSPPLSIGTTGNLVTSGSISANSGSVSGNALSGTTVTGGTITATSSSSLAAATATGLAVNGAATISALTVNTTSTLTGDVTASGNITASAGTITGNAITATTSTLGAATSTSLNVSGATTLGAVTAGATTASGLTVSGSTSLADVTASGAATLGSLTVSGGTTLGTLTVGNVTGSGNANFGSGTVTAAHFVGAVDVGSNGGNLSGVVALSNGGTSYAASSALDLLGHLGGTNATNLTSGTLGSGLFGNQTIGGGALVNGGVSATQLDLTGIAAGSYGGFMVHTDGRIYGYTAPTTNALDDGNGNKVTVGTNGVTISFNNIVKDTFNPSGWLGIGTATPRSELDVGAESGAVMLPVGTAGDRPATAYNGMIRYNTTKNLFEAYQNNQWASLIAGGCSGCGLNSGIFLGSSAMTSNPSIQTDVTTGFYSIGTAKIDIGVSGTQIAEFNSGGFNVVTGGIGIGTTTPQSKLDVYGGVAIGTSYAGTTAAPTSGLIVDGQVGIGTGVPNNQLSINAAAGDAITFSSLGDLYLVPSPLSSSGAGVYGQNAYSGVDTSIGIYGLATNSNASITGLTFGIVGGAVAGTDNVANGVLGYETGAGGAGVWGIGHSAGSYGGFFQADNTSAANTGVGAEAAGPGGTGGYFVASDSSATVNYGVYTEANGSNGYGLYSAGGLNFFDGAVGIGTEDPKSSLDVYDNVAIGSSYAGVTAAPVNGLIIQGAVGIGTATPGYPFTVIGNTYIGGNQFVTGKVGIGSMAPQVSLDLSQKADALALPVGTTGQEPASPTNGMIRYNTTLSDLEAYVDGFWTTLTTGGNNAAIYMGTSALTPDPAASATDTQTGLYTAGAGKIDFTSIGTQVVEISTSGLNVLTGNVGIGTATPTGLLNTVNTVTSTTGAFQYSYSYGWGGPAIAYPSIYSKVTAAQSSNTTADIVGAMGWVDQPVTTTHTSGHITGLSGVVTNESAQGTSAGQIYGVNGEAYNHSTLSIISGLGANAEADAGSTTDQETGGLLFASSVTGATVNFMAGEASTAFVRDGTVTTAEGVNTGVEVDNGTVATVNGLDVETSVTGGSVTGSLSGIYVWPGIGGGTVANRYGIYIDDAGGSVAPGGDDFGIYQVAASQKNYFAGAVGIGTDVPGANLEVHDATTAHVILSDAINQTSTIARNELTGGIEITGGTSGVYPPNGGSLFLFGRNNTTSGGYNGDVVIQFGNSNNGVGQFAIQQNTGQDIFHVNADGSFQAIDPNSGQPYIVSQAPSLGSSTLFVKGRIGISTATPLASLDMSQRTDAIILPQSGSDPSGINGMIRYNSTGGAQAIKAYVNNAWISLASTSSLLGLVLGTSVAVPNPYASASDTQTGLYTAGHGKIDFTSVGTQVVEISTSGLNVLVGNVGIGTATLNANTKLAVNGGVVIGTTYGGAAVPTSGLIVGGSVGIGTTAPDTYAQLLISSAAGGPAGTNVRMQNTASGPTYFLIQGGAADSWKGINFKDPSDNNISFIGQLGVPDGTIGFYNTNALTERMRIGTSGAIGIGTTANGTNAKLAVNGGLAVGTYANTATTAVSNGLIVSGAVGIGTSSPNANAALDLGNTTSSIIVPMGPTEPGSPTAGMMRYNTATSSFEGYDGSGWYDFGGLQGTFDKGTVTAPGWAVSTDTASGLFQSATSSTISIAAGGTEAGRFLQGSGTVVNYPTFTGAATGVNPIIAVAGTDTNISLSLTPKGTGNVIITSGKVGVGTTAPIVKLHLSVDGVSVPTALYNSSNDNFVASYGTNMPNFRLIGADSVTTNGPSFAFTRGRNSFASLAAVQSGDPLGSILYMGYDGSARQTAVQIMGVVDGTPSAGSYVPGALKFMTASTGAASEKMRISASGNIGIGTSAPGNKLDVSGAAVFGTYGGNATIAPSNGIAVSGGVGIGTATLGTNATLAVNGGLAVGTYANTATTAVSNGLIVSGAVGIGTSTITAGTVLDLSNNNSSIILPKGNTGQEPGTPISGMVRYNTANNSFEGYDGTAWYDFGGAVGTFDPGTVTAPGFAVSSDTASGLFQAATSTISIAAGGKEAGRFLQGTGTVVNYPTFTGAATGANPIIAAAGTDTNISLSLTPKGTGNVIVTSGNVGVGTTTPAAGAKLDVAGPVKVAGVGTETCSASTVGMMRYNSSAGYMEICQ